MNFLSLRRLASALSLALLSSCDSGGSGLQQRLVEAEAQRDARAARVSELEKQVQALERRLSESTATSSQQAEDRHSHTAATVAAQAELVGRDVQALVKPAALKVFGEVVFAGFIAERGDGTFTGTSVPFFGDGEGGWRCGLSHEQIKNALLGQSETAAPTPPPLTVTAPGSSEPTKLSSPPAVGPSGRKVISLRAEETPVPESVQNANPGAKMSMTVADPENDEVSVPVETKANGIKRFFLNQPVQPPP